MNTLDRLRPAQGRRRPILVAAMLAVSLVVGGVALTGQMARADSASLSDLSIQTLFDGASSPNAVDSSPNNGVVASNDTVGFEWSFTATNDLNAANFAQTLPAGWTWDTSALSILTSDSSLYQSTATISSDGRTLTALISTTAGSTIELKTLVARPDATVPNGSVYAPSLDVAVSNTESISASTSAITVANRPQADLAKSVAQWPTPLTVGGIAGYSAIYNITESVPTGQIGSRAGVQLVSPFSVSDTFTGLDGATATLISPTTGATLTQNGDTLTLTVTSGTVSAASSATQQVMLWWPDSLLPQAPAQAAVNVSNTATPTNWVDQSGDAIAEADVSNNTANVSLQLPAPAGISGPGYGKDLWVAKNSTPAFDKEPNQDPADWQQIATNQPVSHGATIDARFYFHASLAADGTSLGSTNLVANDFWNPAVQQLIDNGTSQYVGDDTGTPLPPSAYSIQYTTGSTTAGPWFPSVAATGGVAHVSGVRYLVNGDYAHGAAGPYLWLVGTASFLAVGPPSQTSVSDTAVFTSDRPADTGATVGNAFIIENTVLGLTDTTNKATVTSGGTVTYTLQPTVNPPAGSTTASTSALVVTETLPGNVTEVDLSGVDPFWTATRSVSSSGQIVVTYTHAGFVTQVTPIPAITFVATTDVSAPVNGAMTDDSTATSTDAAPAAAAVGVAVLQANVTTQTMTTPDPTVDVNATTATWQASWFNYTQAGQGTSYFVDVLPYNGDARGTHFTGTATLAAATVAADPSSGSVIEYTTDPAASVAGRAANDPATQWTTLGSTDPSTLTGVTALRVKVTQFGTGSTGVGHLTVSLALNGETTGNSYGNTSKGFIGTSNRTLPDTSTSTVTVVSGTVSGRVVNDVDSSGTVTPGDTGLSGVTVELINNAGLTLQSAHTDSSGAYSFTSVPGGSYRVRVDTSSLPAGATQTFGPDATLDNRSAAITLATGGSVSSIDFGYDPPITPSTVINQLSNLAFTGTNPTPLIIVSALLLLAGISFITAARLRRRPKGAHSLR